MRAAVLHSSPGTLSIEDGIEVGHPIGEEVLVRVAATGVCHSDLHFTTGTWTCPCPTVLGHEMAGIVEAVGPEVTEFDVGDHVVGCLTPFCGRCSACLAGRMTLCRAAVFARPADADPRLRHSDGQPMHQFVNLSAFAEQALVHRNTLVRIDRELPLATAAVFGCAVLTGVGAVMNTARLTPGQTCVVIGAGGIGLNAIQGARLCGASRIIAVDRNPDKLEPARRFGATDTVVSTDSVVSDVLKLTGGGVDHAFEAVGSRGAAMEGFEMLGLGGTLTIVGLIPQGQTVEFTATDFILSEKVVQGSNMGSNRFRTDIPMLIDLYRQGRLLIDELLTQQITLDELPEAFRQLADGEVTRSVVVFDHTPTADHRPPQEA